MCGKVCEVHGTLVCNDALQSGSNDQSGSTDYITQWCAASPVGGQTGNEYVYALEVPSNTHAGITLANLSADLSLFVVGQVTAGVCSAESCVIQPSLQQGLQSESAWVIPDLNPRTIYVAVDAPNEGAGNYTLDVFCWKDEKLGLCSNSTDEDDDWLKDCADPGCASSSVCQASLENGALCADGVDNDGNGTFDCQDTTCGSLPYCVATNIEKQDFENLTASDWSVDDGGGDGFTWQHCDVGNGCTRQFEIPAPPRANGSFVFVDSNAAGPERYLNETFTLPAYDIFGKNMIYLRFQHEFKQWGVPQRMDFGFVEVSSDGSTWIPVYRVGDDESREVVVDLAGAPANLAGSSSAYVRFRYNDNGEWGFHWMIDTVELITD